MKTCLVYCYEMGLRYFILGKGSNTLFDDRGFNGLVILNKIDFLKREGATFTAGSGYSFPRLGKKTADLNYTGLEFAAGIPATVGGAVFMNAGAGGQETKDYLHFVLYLTEKGEEVPYRKEDLTFSYRFSPFQKMKGAILEAEFHLKEQEGTKHYQKKTLEYRLSTQPYKEPSIGCIFRNPKEGAAAYFIEKCGLKGQSVGGAIVSLKHANFIVNPEGAKAVDVLDLIKTIKSRVFEETGVHLEEEIRFLSYE